jgi:hypothetical protein
VDAAEKGDMLPGVEGAGSLMGRGVAVICAMIALLAGIEEEASLTE